MGLFSPYKDKEKDATSTTRVARPAGPKVVGKAQPTPSRRDAELARRQRINPQLSPKEAKRKNRVAATAERRKRMEALDNVPTKRLMRDHVDSRFNVAEWSMPVLMLLLVFSLLVTPAVPSLAETMLYATWAFMALVVLDIFLMWRGYKKLAAERLPKEPVKGMLYYGFNRSLSLRRLRIPAPRVKRGEKI